MPVADEQNWLGRTSLFIIWTPYLPTLPVPVPESYLGNASERILWTPSIPACSTCTWVIPCQLPGRSVGLDELACPCPYLPVQLANYTTHTPNCPSDSHVSHPYMSLFQPKLSFSKLSISLRPTVTHSLYMLKFGIWTHFQETELWPFCFTIVILIDCSVQLGDALIICERKKADERKVGTWKNLCGKNHPAVGVKLSPLSSSSSPYINHHHHGHCHHHSNLTNEGRILDHWASIICIKEKWSGQLTTNYHLCMWYNKYLHTYQILDWDTALIPISLLQTLKIFTCLLRTQMPLPMLKSLRYQ